MTLSNKDRQQLIANYIEKAKNTEKALPNLLANNQLFAAVNRIYYGLFYMLSALALFSINLVRQNIRSYLDGLIRTL